MGIRCAFWATVVALLLVVPAFATESLRWELTLDSAKRRAAQTNRPVLIHFWADWCSACRRMEQEVFTRPEVISTLESDFVSVKVNVDHFPATRRHYGVTALPTDIIITPQGLQIEQLCGAMAPGEYLARLDQVAARIRGQTRQLYAQTPGARPPAPAGGTDPAPNPAGQPAGRGQPVGSRPAADYVNRRPPFSVASVSPGDERAKGAGATPYGVLSEKPPIVPPHKGASRGLAPQVQPPAPSQRSDFPPAHDSAGARRDAQIPPANPPLGLDGFCPVHLVEQKDSWAKGDPRWGAIHRGRTYLFCGPQQQRRFLSAPDCYAPVLSGNDVVLAIDRGQTVAGHRGHGVFFGDRVYLFASEASLEKFSENPDYYAGKVLQARQSEMTQRLGSAPRPGDFR